MELWIRSQDKVSLTKIDNLCCIDNRIVFIPLRQNGRMTLGKYATEERALEVFDEIQSRLNIRHSSGASAEFIVLSEIVPIIYEMPEE